MSPKKSVECQVTGLRQRYEYKPISFNTGSDLSLILQGNTGPGGISPVTADLLDFGAAIYQIERQLRRMNTNPLKKSLANEAPAAAGWNGVAIKAAQDALYLLGDAVWELDFQGVYELRYLSTKFLRSRRRNGCLDFGGMDSACGLATTMSDASKTQLVGFYTRQKNLQKTSLRTWASSV